MSEIKGSHGNETDSDDSDTVALNHSDAFAKKYFSENSGGVSLIPHIQTTKSRLVDPISHDTGESSDNCEICTSSKKSCICKEGYKSLKERQKSSGGLSKNIQVSTTQDVEVSVIDSEIDESPLLSLQQELSDQKSVGNTDDIIFQPSESSGVIPVDPELQVRPNTLLSEEFLIKEMMSKSPEKHTIRFQDPVVSPNSQDDISPMSDNLTQRSDKPIKYWLKLIDDNEIENPIALLTDNVPNNLLAAHNVLLYNSINSNTEKIIETNIDSTENISKFLNDTTDDIREIRAVISNMQKSIDHLINKHNELTTAMKSMVIMCGTQLSQPTQDIQASVQTVSQDSTFITEVVDILDREDKIPKNNRKILAINLEKQLKKNKNDFKVWYNQYFRPSDAIVSQKDNIYDAPNKYTSIISGMIKVMFQNKKGVSEEPSSSNKMVEKETEKDEYFKLLLANMDKIADDTSTKESTVEKTTFSYDDFEKW